MIYRKIFAFNLIELMVTVAIVALFVGIAIPTYSDHVIDTKVANYLNFMTKYELDVTTYMSQYGTWPQLGDLGIDSETGLVNVGIRNVHIDDSEVGAGWIGFYPDEDDLGVPVIGDGMLILLRPTVNGDRIDWDCGVSGTSGRDTYLEYMPSNCQNSWTDQNVDRPTS